MNKSWKMFTALKLNFSLFIFCLISIEKDLDKHASLAVAREALFFSSSTTARMVRHFQKDEEVSFLILVGSNKPAISCTVEI